MGDKEEGNYTAGLSSLPSDMESDDRLQDNKKRSSWARRWTLPFSNRKLFKKNSSSGTGKGKVEHNRLSSQDFFTRFPGIIVGSCVGRSAAEWERQEAFEIRKEQRKEKRQNELETRRERFQTELETKRAERQAELETKWAERQAKLETKWADRQAELETKRDEREALQKKELTEYLAAQHIKILETIFDKLPAFLNSIKTPQQSTCPEPPQQQPATPPSVQKKDS